MLNPSPESEMHMCFERLGEEYWALHLRGFQGQWHHQGKTSPVRTRKQSGHIPEKPEDEGNFLGCETGNYTRHSERHQEGKLRDQPVAGG